LSSLGGFLSASFCQCVIIPCFLIRRFIAQASL
jgi:hypothetical protein